jgi:non-heme chloroperoxidase
MFALAEAGYRCIAHDRRGFGRSDQPWQGNTMETFADDLATLLETLDIQDAMLVGHSMGGAEVARYIGKYGTKRVSRAVLIAAVTPSLAQSPTNPDGVPMALLDQMRAGLEKDRPHFLDETSKKFYNANRLLSGVSQALREMFVADGMQASIKTLYDCIAEFSEIDYSMDLAAFSLPTLLIHGDDDQIVPLAITSERAAAILPDATLQVYEGASHGLCATHANMVTDDLLAFAGARTLVTR